MAKTACERKAKKVIHVNQHVIRRNKKTGEREPPFTVKFRGKNTRATRVTVGGVAELVYRPDKPLSCGATCWIETTAPVKVDDRYINDD